MRKVLCLASAALLLSLATTTASLALPKDTPVKSSKAAWESKWEDVLTAGKKEGVVRIYGTWTPAVRAALTKAFGSRYGISLEFVVGRGAELVPKLTAERQAGLNLADVIGTGTNSFLTLMKPAGLLGPLEPLLILPEVLDSKAWPKGQIPFTDKDHYVVPILAVPQRFFAYNKLQIKEGELTAYKDVLQPKYKGKIVMGDPSITGAGSALFARLAHDWVGVEETKDFLKRLLTEQRAVISRDYRNQIEEIAKGKYAIGLGTQNGTIADFLASGAPIAVVPTMDVDVTPESGAIAVPKTPAHPHAAAVFVNWILSAEGATTFSKSSGMPVVRLGVSKEAINPFFLTGPETRLYMETEEYIIFAGQMRKAFKQIIDTHGK